MNKHPFWQQIALFFTLSALVLISACRPDPGGEPGDVADLAKLAGDWIRVESNNPTSDFIQIEVIGSTGTITDPASSGFSAGDAKWASITPATSNTYDYQELGSDYNYYNATITLVNDDELRLTVESSGAGNSQKWIRDDGTIAPDPTVEATVLDCNFFTEDRILENTAAAIDYIVPNNCVLDITAALEIKPGVVIQVEENGGFGVYDQGTLKMVGTEAEPIIIKGAAASQGYWRGIHIETNSINNQMEYVQISDAGSNYVYCCNTVASVFLKGGKLAISNTTISNGAEYGLYANEAADLATFANNTITTHAEAPMYLHLERTAQLDGLTSDYTGNEDDFIRIFKSTVDTELEIPANNVPYLFDSEVINLTEVVAVDPGAELVFKENAGLGVYDDGALALNGSAGNEVILRGLEANKGYWRGVHIETNSSNNKFAHAQISDAGSNYVYCCNTVATVFLKGGRLEMTNTRLSNGAEYGLYANADANLAVYSANSVTTHDNYPLYMYGDRFGELDGSNSSYVGNSKDFLGVFNSQVRDAMTWTKNDVPYLIETVIDIIEPLTIEAGAELVFEEDGGLGVYDSGTLSAVGTASDKIIFRGKENINGYWRGIHVETNSSNNEFIHTEVKNGGSNYVYCCNNKANILLKGGQMTVSNSEISESGGCGIYVQSNGTLTESDNSFSGNMDGTVCQ
ncbi:MAG: hypothetical protein AAF399_06000 [Bacteroidota bacterium]